MQRTTTLRRVLFASFIVIGLLAIAGACWADKHENPNPGIKPWNAQYIQLAEQWMKWIFSQPAETNPAYDLTGAFAANGQPTPDNIFFLAGLMTSGNETKADRTITISPNQRLFFPVINYWDIEWDPDSAPRHMVWKAPYSGLYDPATIYANADAAMLESSDGMYATIDGEDVKNLEGYRTITPLFNSQLPEENLLGSWGYTGVWGLLGPNMTDGYFLLLEPLAPGDHVIEFGQNNWPMHIKYTITVKPGLK